MDCHSLFFCLFVVSLNFLVALHSQSNLGVIQTSSKGNRAIENEIHILHDLEVLSMYVDFF